MLLSTVVGSCRLVLLCFWSCPAPTVPLHLQGESQFFFQELSQFMQSGEMDFTSDSSSRHVTRAWPRKTHIFLTVAVGLTLGRAPGWTVKGNESDSGPFAGTLGKEARLPLGLLKLF